MKKEREFKKNQKIYLLIMHTNTKWSRFIRFFTRFEYSHVAISFDKNCDYIYSFGRKRPNTIIGGFTKEYKHGEFFSIYSKTKCKIYEVNVTKKQYKRLYKIIDSMCKNKNKYKYDYVGVIVRWFKIPLRFKNRYVCSYFVASILKEAKIYDFNKKSYYVEPRDFDNMDGVSLIYKGLYKKYE